jgi:alginate O-acetyltransferase complex protein AlgI
MLFFLPIVVLGCIFARKVGGPRAAHVWVLIASIFFYGYWRPINLVYLAVSILVNWLLAQWMVDEEQPRRKRILQLGLVLNIGYLCTFKYVNFFLSNVPFLSHSRFHMPELAFPLGISFFTLAQIMYQVDCYEKLLPALNLFDHSTFVAFFPYVISGPIAKAKRMAHQFGNFGGEPDQRSALIARGVYVFTLGLFKKVVFADSFAGIANYGFGLSGRRSLVEVWVFSVAYTMQIYFDFSGYSDMAMGSAMMLGVEIPRNFDAPLRSKSIIEFWQRWHISLSNFITTYLYTPIIRSFKKADLRASAFATLCAMAIAGLWHGPSWTFVAFGVLHGCGLALNQYWRKTKKPKLPPLLSWFLTFCMVNIAFICFRSRDLHQAAEMTASLVNLHNVFASASLHALIDEAQVTRVAVPLGVGLILAFFGKSSDQLGREFKPSFGNAAAVAGMVVVCWIFMAFFTTQEFLYFKF